MSMADFVADVRAGKIMVQTAVVTGSTYGTGERAMTLDDPSEDLIVEAIRRGYVEPDATIDELAAEVKG